jgi:hypothetical protein
MEKLEKLNDEIQKLWCVDNEHLITKFGERGYCYPFSNFAKQLFLS